MNESRHIGLAALFSLLLHAMLLGIPLGSSTGRNLALTLNDLQGAMARLDGGVGEIAVLLVNEDREAETASPNTSFDLKKENEGMLTTTARADTAEPLSELTSPDNPLDPADSASTTTPMSSSGASSPVQHSIPLDAYRAQIMGRIERAWERPLVRLEHTFRCEVEISQTPQGEVRAITLTDCDGDPAWRESISRAIRHAAPLPAPPSQDAFRSVVTLRFQSEPLSPALLAQLLSVSEENLAVDNLTVEGNAPPRHP